MKEEVWNIRPTTRQNDLLWLRIPNVFINSAEKSKTWRIEAILEGYRQLLTREGRWKSKRQQINPTEVVLPHFIALPSIVKELQYFKFKGLKKINLMSNRTHWQEDKKIAVVHQPPFNGRNKFQRIFNDWTDWLPLFFSFSQKGGRKRICEWQLWWVQIGFD